MAGKITISDDCDCEGEENMSKQKLMLGAILVAAGLLMGCAGTAKGSTEEDTGAAAVEKVQSDENGNASAEEDTISEDENGLTAEAQTEDVESSDPGNSGENEQMDTYVILPNPSFSYYRSDRVQERELTAIALIKESEEPNEIIDEDKWFQDNGLQRQGFPYEDGEYRYEAFRNEADQPALFLTELATGKTVTFDLREYQYSTEYVEADYDYIDQNLLFAAVRDNILYLATGHYTYAESCPQTAYITAVDLTDNSVLWKTEPLTCNARGFAFVDDYIICGYGFTAEDDYLKIVRIDTGEVVQEIPVKTAPDYIIWQDGILYVRTYDTNYTFMIAIE